MDQLDKLEIIIKAEIKEKKAEFERSKEIHSSVYVDGLRQQIDVLSWALTIVWSVRHILRQRLMR